MNRIRSSSLAIAVFLAVRSATAATFVVPEDREMIRRAELIVIGTVQDSYSEVTADGRLHTVNEIAVENALKGNAVRGQVIRDVELGGVVAGRRLQLSGVPRYRTGDRVLAMLWKNAHGEWTTTEFVLGKFRFDRSLNGRELLVRDSGEICGWDSSWHPYVERTRSAREFIDYIRRVSRGEQSVSTDYFVSGSDACTSMALQDTVASTYPASAYLGFKFNFFSRWPNPTASFKTSGTQPGVDSLGAAQRALAVWTNDPNSSINYTYGGTSTVTCSGLSDVCSNEDSENTIVYNDPSNEITGTFNGSGTLAVGGPWMTDDTHVFAGETFNNIVNGDLVVQNGIGNYLSQSQFDSVIAHELGHTLGFRHSNKDADENSCDSAVLPCSNNALMTSSLNNGPQSATLLQWDKDAAAAVYGAVAGCTPVSITGHPSSATVAYNTGTTLAVGTSGTDPKTYQWYIGTSGSTAAPIAGANGSAFTTGPLTATTSYWVRVTNCDGSSTASSNTSTVTVATGSIRKHTVRRSG